jgi:hypothetical protein
MQAKVTPLVSHKRAPVVYFSDVAWCKLWIIVDQCQKEVGWYGTVDKLPSGDYMIEDIFVPEQTVSGVTTDIEPEALGELALQLEQQGIDSSRLRYWGHSHVNMEVSPSATDEEQIEEYLDDCDWFIRGIHNKRRASKIDVYEVKQSVIFERVQNGTLPLELADEDKKALLEDIKNNVKERTYKNTPSIYANEFHRRNQAYPTHANSGAGTKKKRSYTNSVGYGDGYIEHDGQMYTFEEIEMLKDPFYAKGN